jgi:non-heme chloroperoxidase
VSPVKQKPPEKRNNIFFTMPFFTSPVDSTTLYYKYYEPDQAGYRSQNQAARSLTLVFLHGWPMSSSMFEHLLVPLCETYRLRCIAPDRRGFGKSDWNNGSESGPITFDTFVKDTVALLQHLKVGDFIFAGASMGSAESLLVYLGSTFVQERCKVRL